MCDHCSHRPDVGYYSYTEYNKPPFSKPIEDAIKLLKENIKSNEEKKMSEYVKMTLPSGVTLEGEMHKVADSAKKLGHDFSKDTSWYYSESKGQYLYMPNMAAEHLRNAFLKRLAKVEHGVSKKLNNETFHKIFYKTAQDLGDPVLIGLLSALIRKK